MSGERRSKHNHGEWKESSKAQFKKEPALREGGEEESSKNISWLFLGRRGERREVKSATQSLGQGLHLLHLIKPPNNKDPQKHKEQLTHQRVHQHHLMELKGI